MMSNPNRMIEIENLTRVFSNDEVKTSALSGINLVVGEGEFVAITGSSGCGKSTLLSILGLLDQATAGRYSLSGHDVSSLSKDDRCVIRNREIGFVFQAFNLIGDLTVFENIELPLTLRKDLSKDERKKRVEECLIKVNMIDRSKHFPSQLSGGQMQRVAIARALVTQPSVILADEPTGNLDSFNADAIMALLAKLNSEGKTIVMVTHDAKSAGYATREVAMNDGNVVSDSIKDVKRTA